MNDVKYIITVFATDEIKTGAHKRYAELINGLSDRGYKVICYSPTDFFGDRIHRFIPVELKKKSLIPLTLQLVYQVIKNSDFNEIRTNSKILIFGETPALSGIALKLKDKIPLVLGVRTSILEDRMISINKNGLRLLKFRIRSKLICSLYIKVYSYYEKLMYSYADIITVQNEIDKSNVKAKSTSKTIEIIPNNINVPWIENSSIKDSNRSENVRRIGFVGSLITRKGIIPLLKAYKQLVNEGIDLELHLAGEGPMQEEIEEYITKEKLNKVYLYGYLSEPMLFLKDMDLTVVPSLVDSFPNVVFESWYVGTPVIGSRVGGIQYQLDDNRLQFDPDSSNDLYSKLRECLDSNFYNQIKKISKERRSSFEFDWVGRYETIINISGS